ncbi:MAG TPA: type II toxin-antitoxin system VapC family toxin [Thermoanaerobaculia bacterium]|nr:type II toxin-antitoxin system VapC family toxin [Thermoanaerobaculia bacterium]
MIVIDTHALIWWISDPTRLSGHAREAIDRAALVCIPAITCFEVAFLAERRRIAIDSPAPDWLDEVIALPRVALMPLTIDVPAAAAKLPDPLRDPADRLIVATALQMRVPLVTADHKIIASGVVTTIW